MAALPLVAIDQTVPGIRICTVRFNVTVPAIGLENGHNVEGVCGSQRRVSLDNNEVIVIFAGSFKPEVVRARHDNGIFAERIEDDYFTVDVDHAGAEQLLLPLMELVLDVVRYQDVV